MQYGTGPCSLAGLGLAVPGFLCFLVLQACIGPSGFSLGGWCVGLSMGEDSTSLLIHAGVLGTLSATLPSIGDSMCRLTGLLNET